MRKYIINGKTYYETGERYNFFVKQEENELPIINNTGKIIFAMAGICLICIATLQII